LRLIGTLLRFALLEVPGTLTLTFGVAELPPPPPHRPGIGCWRWRRTRRRAIEAAADDIRRTVRAGDVDERIDAERSGIGAGSGRDGRQAEVDRMAVEIYCGLRDFDADFTLAAGTRILNVMRALAKFEPLVGAETCGVPEPLLPPPHTARPNASERLRKMAFVGYGMLGRERLTTENSILPAGESCDRLARQASRDSLAPTRIRNKSS
jgi:hypothetical protein